MPPVGEGCKENQRIARRSTTKRLRTHAYAGDFNGDPGNGNGGGGGKGGGGNDNGGGDSSVGGASWTGGGLVLETVGKVLFTMGGVDYVLPYPGVIFGVLGWGFFMTRNRREPTPTAPAMIINPRL